jgi:quinol-cytochrome oxidoreductase complex cytochrome b subunit
VIVLGYVGTNPADAYLLRTTIALVWIGWLGTLYYFLQFWAITPLVGKIESTMPLPDSIAKPVLATTTLAD